MSTPPLACSLTDEEERARRRQLQEEFRAGVRETRELEDGFALRFPAEPRWLRDLAELVVLERQCCRFLRLELVAEPEEGPIWLTLRGPEGTKEFLARTFALCAAGT